MHTLIRFVAWAISDGHMQLLKHMQLPSKASFDQTLVICSENLSLTGATSGSQRCVQSMDARLPKGDGLTGSLFASLTTIIAVAALARNFLPHDWIRAIRRFGNNITKLLDPFCYFTFNEFAGQSPDQNYDRVKLYLSDQGVASARRWEAPLFHEVAVLYMCCTPRLRPFPTAGCWSANPRTLRNLSLRWRTMKLSPTFIWAYLCFGLIT